jgi:hypothetical protein
VNWRIIQFCPYSQGSGALKLPVGSGLSGLGYLRDAAIRKYRGNAPKADLWLNATNAALGGERPSKACFTRYEECKKVLAALDVY